MQNKYNSIELDQMPIKPTLEIAVFYIGNENLTIR